MRERTKLICAVVVATATPLAGVGYGQATRNFELVPTIAFSNAGNNPCVAAIPAMKQPSVGEIYLMGLDGTARQLTDNNDCTHFDLFANLSGDGKKVVFDSNRLRSATDPLNTSDLFVMEADGSNQQFLIRGSSASWSPALSNGQGTPISRQIVFHASASGTGLPITTQPGAPALDNDLFVLNVDDCLQYLSLALGTNCRDLATNITKDLEPNDSAPDYNDGQVSPPNPPAIEEDADWSPDGSKIIFTSHGVNPVCVSPGVCIYPDTQIYTINADGTGLTQLTHPDPNLGLYEKRAAAWSADGSHIAYMCAIGPLTAQGIASFEICVIPVSGDGDGTQYTRLTWNSVLDASPSWSPDGSQIVIHKNPPPYQLWVVRADTVCTNGSCTCPDKYPNGKCETQLTNTPGIMNGYPHWGELRVRKSLQ
jgi:Tol biopolymer transport system component